MSTHDANHPNTPGLSRRRFLQTSAAGALAGAAGRAYGQDDAPAGDGLDHRNERPDRMSYRKLGKTDFMCSRLVFGCGAALAGGKAVRLLERAFEAGINFYDVGYDDYYKGSEHHLGPFVNRHRDDVWVTSKAPARLGRNADGLTAESAKFAADYWSNELDKSLNRMEIDYVDAYYFMGVSDPELVKSEELANAFFKAKEAGKVRHLGISTHKNAQECLEAATEAGHYSLAMIAITPGGWYDYTVKKLLSEKGAMTSLKPVLDRAREAGIGLIGMKAARPIAPAPYGGRFGNVEDAAPTDAFDQFYGDKLLNAGLSPFQRSYAYVLQHGLDVVNADMQNFKHFEENVIAARDAEQYLA